MIRSSHPSVNVFLSGLTVFLWILSPALGSADEEALVRSFLQRGQQAAIEQDLEQAIDDFSRVLLIDPRNQTAQTWLLKTARQMDIPSELKINLLVFEDLANLNNDLVRKIRYFDEKNQWLTSELKARGASLENIEEQFPETMDVPEGRELVSGEKGPLIVLNDFLSQEKERLEGQLSLGQETNRHLQTLYRETIASLSPQALPVESSQGVSTATGDNEVVQLSLLVTEKNMEIQDTQSQIQWLQGKSQELQSRLALGQKLIQEKDQLIDQLTNEMNKVQVGQSAALENRESVISSQDEKLIELTGILNIYKAKLGDTHRSFKETSANMVVLEEQLDGVHKELFEKNQLLRQTKEKLAVLEAKIAEFQKSLDQLMSPSSQDSSHQNLEGCIFGLQKQLKEVKLLLSEHLQHLETLDTQVSVKNPPISTE
ncbi:MAG: hypothetical protein Q7S13_04340 [Candidatus Omnitrophota bacterium]|nr:hypothetical protein [Candidatus Omnitrophota bacterium]